MSNAQGKQRAAADKKTDDDTAKADAQAAQIDEATGADRTFTYEGDSYRVLDGQPSPKAITYIARWTVNEERLAMVLAIVEMIGQEQWELWCERHGSDKINEFWLAVDAAAAAGAPGN